MDLERNLTLDASSQNNNGQLDQTLSFYAENNLSGDDLTNALSDLDAYADSLGGVV